jgi:hypothetical protein
LILVKATKLIMLVRYSPESGHSLERLK